MGEEICGGGSGGAGGGGSDNSGGGWGAGGGGSQGGGGVGDSWGDSPGDSEGGGNSGGGWGGGAQCVKPITFSQVSVLPKPTLLSCHLGRPESRSKACLSCSSHFDPFYGQKVPKMAINAVFWP